MLYSCSRFRCFSLSLRSLRLRAGSQKNVRWAHIRVEDHISRPSIWRPVGFTLAVGCCSFSVAGIVHYERRKSSTDSWRKKLKLKNHTWDQIQLFDILRQVTRLLWSQASELQRVTLGIIAVNTCIYLLWQVPSLNRFMMRWFLASPTASSLTLLTSSFSHMNLWHLFLNMYVFWNFHSLFEKFMSAEAFLAFYVTAGATSGLASHLVKVFRSSLSPSLGASGALLAAVGMVCFAMPDLKLHIIFLPWITLPAGKGLLAMAGIDLVGVLRSWQFFDHAGHLGGVLFGCWYLLYGQKVLWESLRKRVVRAWMKVTGQA